jgi:iron complex outermembrane receptor protein
VLLLCTSFLFAQQTYTIKVIDANTRNPLSDVTVKVRGTNNGASTGADGSCKILASPNDILEVSSIGYANQSLKMGNRPEITIALEYVAIDVGEVVIVGSRGVARAKTETAVPVDVIKINQVGLPTAKMDLTSVLNIAAPSYNYNKQSGADGADHIDIGTLRGLGPDHTLVYKWKKKTSNYFCRLVCTRRTGWI